MPRDAITTLLLRPVPPVPEKRKRAKTGPCAMFFLLAAGRGHALARLWPKAFDTLNVRVSVAGGSDDQAFLEDVRWRAVASSRAKRGQRMEQEPSAPVLLATLALLMEVTHWLTLLFARASSSVFRAKQTAMSHPPLCDFCDWARRPITRALQYLSCLLSGASARLRIVWMRGGHGSFEERAAAPENFEALRIFRHATTALAASLRRRFWVTAMR